MAKKQVGITRNKTREEQIVDTRNLIVKQLFADGFSYGEIEQIVRINKGSANRIIRFGTNRNGSKSITAA